MALWLIKKMLRSPSLLGSLPFTTPRLQMSAAGGGKKEEWAKEEREKDEDEDDEEE